MIDKLNNLFEQLDAQKAKLDSTIEGLKKSLKDSNDTEFMSKVLDDAMKGIKPNPEEIENHIKNAK